MVWLSLTIGLALLAAGGEALVKGSVAVASRLGVSPLVIGLTLVGFGTSTPELVASVEAALIGAPGIAVGNIVGSNIANILLILGVSALIMPMATTREAFQRDGMVLIAATVLMLGVAWAGEIGRLTGTLFLLLLGLYLAYAYSTERKTGGPEAERHAAEAAEVMPKHMALWIAILFAVGGIAAVVYGADLLVGAAIDIARGAGLSDAVIGVTLVAVGTSLPELVTSVMAALRRHTDVAFGNIVGSNIFNILGIAGTTALVKPIAVPAEIARFDIWAMLAATLLLIAFAVTGWRVNRWEAGIFLLAYVGYLFVQLSPAARATLGLI